jgi:dihydrolipoamide dehydrogenase
MNQHTTTLLVIGGGPGGYIAAIRAGQLGIPTTLVEADELGGTCLNVGCIPSKALIHAAEEFEKASHFASGSSLGISVQAPRIDIGQTVLWKDGIVGRLTSGVAALLKKSGVRVVKGWANIVDGKTVEVVRDGESPQRIGCEHLLLATGSHATELPFMPFGGKVISATEALSPKTVPGQLVVVGAGYIGLELGIAYAKLGAQVHVVEAQERVLPAYDSDLTRPVAIALKGMGARPGPGRRRRAHPQRCGRGVRVGGGPGAGRCRPAPEHTRLRPRKAAHRYGWPLHQGRRPVPYFHARRVGNR